LSKELSILVRWRRHAFPASRSVGRWRRSRRCCRLQISLLKLAPPVLVKGGAQVQRQVVKGSGTADGRISSLRVFKVSSHLASRLGRGCVGRATRNRVEWRGQDRAQRAKNIRVVMAGSRRFSGYWRGASRRASDRFLRDDGSGAQEGANRGLPTGVMIINVSCEHLR
jgi:hypothetical protein